MDLVDVAVLALRLALVLILYAFLLGVLRAATRSLRPAAPDPTLAPEPGPAPRVRQAATPARAAPAPLGARLRLSVVEPGDSGLAPGSILDLADGAVLGRAEGRDVVVLADPAVSSQHARLARRGTRWVVIDLGSTNGTLVNQELVADETGLATDDVLGLGKVRLRVLER